MRKTVKKGKEVITTKIRGAGGRLHQGVGKGHPAKGHWGLLVVVGGPQKFYFLT